MNVMSLGRLMLEKATLTIYLNVWMNIMRIYGRSDDMFKKLTVQEQIRLEGQRSLQFQNKQKETEEILLEQLVDIDFRQSLMEMGV